MKWLSSYSPSRDFKFSDRPFSILWNEWQCVVWIETVVFTHLTEVMSHDLTVIVSKQVVLYPLPTLNTHTYKHTTSGLGTPLTVILAMRENFPQAQDTLKQLDMNYRASLTWFQKLRTLHQRDETNYYSRWNYKNQNLEIIGLSL